MSRYSSKSDRAALDRKILAGVDKHVTKAFVLNGESVTAKTFNVAIDKALSTQDEVDEQRLQLAALVKVADAAAARATQLTSALKKYLIIHYGVDSPVLADFGFAPKKVAQKTIAEKYEAVEKQLATRAARHTMGSRQKAAIHGVPADATVAPLAAPPTPAQPTATNGANGAVPTASLFSLNGGSR